ncbi:MAG: ATP-binding protein [bacterium]
MANRRYGTTDGHSRWSMDVCIDGDPNILRAARKIAGAAALALGAPVQTAFDLEVALGEALSNAFIHAYGARGGQILMHFAFDNTRMTLTISDEGKELRKQPKIPATVPLTNARGRGLYLMSHLMDDVKVIHPYKGRRGTAIRMKKQLVKKNGGGGAHGDAISPRR